VIPQQIIATIQHRQPLHTTFASPGLTLPRSMFRKQGADARRLRRFAGRIARASAS
jgi:hypothetical protein